MNKAHWFMYCTYIQVWWTGRLMDILLSNQKHLRYKKEQTRTKTGLAEKDAKTNGRPIARQPCFDRFDGFCHDDLTAKHAQGLLMLMKSNF